jgi:hypothetical protein
MTDLELDAVGALPPPEPEVPIPDALQGSTSYLCGPAGTGKTYLARAMVRQLPGTLLCATTGIAAVNLGEGTTINAALGYFDTKSLEENYVSGRLGAILGKLWRAGTRRILLDEVSMLDAAQLTILTRALDELGGKGFILDAQLADEIRDSGETEAPIALTLIGDFAQLPPVKAPFAFESPEWSKYADHIHKLTIPRRQADPGFLAALGAARQGVSGPVVDYFAPRLEQGILHDFPGCTLMATNDAVDRYNALRMDGIDTREVHFASGREGKQRTDWKNIPDVVALKEGALVMILANARDPENRRMIYANGDLGTVVQMDGTQVCVQLQRNGQVQHIDWVTRYNRIPLEPGRVKELVATGQQAKIERDKNGRAIWEIAGSVVYLPIRVAYASTVHKCQGLTLDNVQINTREGFFKSPGMLYVSLSRCRTPEGLRLIGSEGGLRERVTVHTKVRPWL